ncbi:MAG: Hsp33 family molecular chaperone, partial [Rhizobiaceae bacterium]
QGEHTKRYQGIVQLDGASLEEAARVYFRQSEQIPTEIRIAVARMFSRGENGTEKRWRAGGVLAQFLPVASERRRLPDLPSGDDPASAIEAEDRTDAAWKETQALMATVEASELVDPTVGAERLLFRLFHEHGVRVYESAPVLDDCSCSREKIHSILSGFSAEEIEESVERGAIRVNCEFCSQKYSFDPDEFLARN